jgi:uncharacterized iron-regulated protein
MRRDGFPPQIMQANLPLTGLLLIALLTRFLADSAPASSVDPETPAFQEWQAWEVKTGRPISFEEFADGLGTQEVVYLGEEHRNRWHVEAALKILRALVAGGRQPIVALEMFGWDGQAALDRYLSASNPARDLFLEESRWEQNWGGPYEDYEPLVTFARERRLSVLALNPPKPLVRRVATQGLAQARLDQEMIRWGLGDEPFPEDPAYRDMIVKPLRSCHGGLSEEAYQRMYEASVFRDEGMAKTITEALSRPQAATGLSGSPAPGPIVSYTGSGHIQYRLPVPNRVLRRRPEGVRQATIYLTAFEPGRADEIRRLLHEAVADYVWLTPLGAHGVPRRCR